MNRLIRISGAMIFFIFIAQLALAQNEVKWLTWEDAVEKSKVEPRKFLVDVYTDWCGYCKKMDKSTFQDEQVVKFINANYYPIKFNAEKEGDITLNNETYSLKKNGAKVYHELALEITYGKLSYPTFVFMDEHAKVIQPIAGYKDAQMFQAIMTYFAENHFKTTPWKTYYAKMKN